MKDTIVRGSDIMGNMMRNGEHGAHKTIACTLSLRGAHLAAAARLPRARRHQREDLSAAYAPRQHPATIVENAKATRKREVRLSTARLPRARSAWTVQWGT